MATLGMIMMVVCGCGAVIGAFIYNKYSGKINAERYDTLNNKSDSILSNGDSILTRIDENRDTVLGAVGNLGLTMDSIKKQNTNREKIPIMEKESKPKQDVKIENSPNAIVQQNVHGDNIIKQDIPEPKFFIEFKSDNEFLNDVYVTKAILTIDSKVPLNNLVLLAFGKTITEFSAMPKRSGVAIEGPSGEGDGYYFVNLTNAWGTYEIVITTTEKERPHIEYNYQ